MNSSTRKTKVIVFGIAFWYPLAGVTWQFLHYLIGLRRLGCDLYYVEDCPRMVYDPALNDFSMDAGNNLAAVVPSLERHGFAGRWAFRGIDGRCHGMSETQLAQLYEDADACLNVTGAHELRDEHLSIPRRIYVETDPVATQVLAAAGHEKTIAQLSAHHVLFSYGENIGAPDCLLPASRFAWLPARQPVVFDLWRQDDAIGGEAYTTVATWRNPGKDIVYKGEQYRWSKDSEFARFLDLPACTRAKLEIATRVDEVTAGLLRGRGWNLADSLVVSRMPDEYRRYIRHSRGEFTVAKDQNVRLRSGWFSDRSCCYLAAGRPVITQETGFSKFLPTGQGLFAFRTMDEILTAIDKIESNYPVACRAAREIAAEYFSAEKVLSKLLSTAGLA